MKWILLVAIYYVNSPAVTTQEFDDKAACEFAQSQLHSIQLKGTVITSCLPKSVGG